MEQPKVAPQTEIGTERALFKKARELLNPGPLFRFATYIHAERKLMVFFFVHFMCTMIVWFHYGLIKFNEQEAKVPEGANKYWLKRIAPPLEFGSMHAILFQMALIPLTMSRFSIAALSESILNRFIPMNRAVRIHIHLGYTMVSIVFLATIFFFIFFGTLCRDGEQAFCDKFTDEIMITGYFILAFLLIIGGTSYFRNSIPYEVFYGIHHLVFIMYAVVVAHTFDTVQRNDQRNRSQTFRWFSATLLYYLCDRAAMRSNHKYRSRLVASTTIEGSNGSKMMILKIRRPTLFSFKPGQYAFLRVQDVDIHWHPFSIASGPNAEELEFYIEVFGEKSWTGKLWSILETSNGSVESDLSDLIIDVEIMGPYGTSLSKTEDFSNVLAVGAGTGIVPVLSLFKQHVHSLMRLDPKTYLHELYEHNVLVRQIETAKEAGKGSIMKKAVSSCFLNEDAQLKSRRDQKRDSIRRSITRHDEFNNRQIKASTKDLRQAAFLGTRSIYGVILLCGLPVFGISVIALTISWNTVPIELYGGMTTILRAITYTFHALFALVAIFVWDATTFFAYTDLAFCFLLIPIGNWYLHQKYENNGVLQPPDITLSCLLTGYLTARVWSMVVRPRHCSWRAVAKGNVATLDRLEIVWVTRSSSLVAKILPDIDEIFAKLVNLWGHDDAREVCRFSVYLTDKDKRQVGLLQKEIEKTTLYKQGCILLGRPDFEEIVQDHTLELVCTKRNSYSLLAFCGSPQLATALNQAKISNEMITSMTGNNNHQMEFVSESFGGVKKTPKSSPTPDHSLHDLENPESAHDIEDYAIPPPLFKRGSSGHSMMSSRVSTVYSGSHKYHDDTFTYAGFSQVQC